MRLRGVRGCMVLDRIEDTQLTALKILHIEFRRTHARACVCVRRGYRYGHNIEGIQFFHAYDVSGVTRFSPTCLLSPVS